MEDLDMANRICISMYNMDIGLHDWIGMRLLDWIDSVGTPKQSNPKRSLIARALPAIAAPRREMADTCLRFSLPMCIHPQSRF